MTIADPLHAVDEVPWHRLYDAYGPASDIPARLRALRHPDPVVRKHASTHLSGSIYHQGSRWQASGPAVPFLIALVDDPHTPDRASIVELLTAVAIGERRDDELPFNPDHAFAAAHAITNEQMTHLIHRLYHEDDPLDDADGLALAQAAIARWEADAYQAAADRVDTITTWINDPHVDVAARAAALLAWYPPTPTIVSALLAVPTDQAHTSIRASANVTLAHLPSTDPRINDHLHHQLTPAIPETAAVTAAIALAYRTGNAISEPALTVLIQSTTNDDLPIDITGWDRALRGFIARACQRIGLT